MTAEKGDELDQVLHQYKVLYEVERKQIALNLQLKQQKEEETLRNREIVAKQNYRDNLFGLKE